jgi:very-short-patch-repair endonuclease
MRTKQRPSGDHLTPEQKALWVGLKDCRLAGRKFNIRKRNDHEAVDFFCPSENLIVEINDDSNFNEVSSGSYSTVDDAACVLHFPISRIRVDIGLVLAQIRGHFSKVLVVT